MVNDIMNACALEDRLGQFGTEDKNITQTSEWHRIRVPAKLAADLANIHAMFLLTTTLHFEKGDVNMAMIFCPKFHMFSSNKSR